MILQHTATTITQHQFKESTLLPLSFSNAITSLLDSPRKRYFHDFSLEKTLPSFYCRDTSEIASGIAISKVRRVPIVPSWRSSSVGWTGSRREIRSRVAFASIRLLSRWILPSGGGKNSTDLLKRSEISVESFEIPFRECDFLVLSWNTYYLSSSSELKGQIELEDRGFWICIKSTRVVVEKDIIIWNFPWVILIENNTLVYDEKLL